jgi:hypothetical protein
MQNSDAGSEARNKPAAARLTRKRSSAPEETHWKLIVRRRIQTNQGIISQKYPCVAHRPVAAPTSQTIAAAPVRMHSQESFSSSVAQPAAMRLGRY